MEEEVVKIKFLDHCEDGEDAMEFVVYGVLLNETERAFKIGTWQYVDPHERDKDDRHDNENHFIIVKAAILEITHYQKKGDTFLGT